MDCPPKKHGPNHVKIVPFSPRAASSQHGLPSQKTWPESPQHSGPNHLGPPTHNMDCPPPKHGPSHLKIVALFTSGRFLTTWTILQKTWLQSPRVVVYMACPPTRLAPITSGCGVQRAACAPNGPQSPRVVACPFRQVRVFGQPGGVLAPLGRTSHLECSLDASLDASSVLTAGSGHEHAALQSNDHEHCFSRVVF